MPGSACESIASLWVLTADLGTDLYVYTDTFFFAVTTAHTFVCLLYEALQTLKWKTGQTQSFTYPSLNQSLCGIKVPELGNDFPHVDKSQHGDLQLGEQPFG